MDFSLTEIISASLGTIGVLGSALFLYLTNRKTPGKAKADNYEWVVNEAKSLYTMVHDDLDKMREELDKANEYSTMLLKELGKAKETQKHLEGRIREMEAKLAEKDARIQELEAML